MLSISKFANEEGPFLDSATTMVKTQMLLVSIRVTAFWDHGSNRPKTYGKRRKGENRFVLLMDAQPRDGRSPPGIGR